jgi:hypothetical protein
MQVCYGHAGDGNLHIRIKKEGIPNSYGNEEMTAILREFFVVRQRSWRYLSVASTALV